MKDIVVVLEQIHLFDSRNCIHTQTLQRALQTFVIRCGRSMWNLLLPTNPPFKSPFHLFISPSDRSFAARPYSIGHTLQFIQVHLYTTRSVKPSPHRRSSRRCARPRGIRGASASLIRASHPYRLNAAFRRRESISCS